MYVDTLIYLDVDSIFCSELTNGQLKVANSKKMMPIFKAPPATVIDALTKGTHENVTPRTVKTPKSRIRRDGKYCLLKTSLFDVEWMAYIYGRHYEVPYSLELTPL